MWYPSFVTYFKAWLWQLTRPGERIQYLHRKHAPSLVNLCYYSQQCVISYCTPVSFFRYTVLLRVVSLGYYYSTPLADLLLCSDISMMASQTCTVVACLCMCFSLLIFEHACLRIACWQVKTCSWWCTVLSCGHCVCDHLRFEVLIQENVVPIELKAVFVIYHDLLYTEETADKDVIHLFEQGFYNLSAVFSSQVSPKLLHLPLTSLFRDGWNNSAIKKTELVKGKTFQKHLQEI